MTTYINNENNLLNEDYKTDINNNITLGEFQKKYNINYYDLCYFRGRHFVPTPNGASGVFPDELKNIKISNIKNREFKIDGFPFFYKNSFNQYLIKKFLFFGEHKKILQLINIENDKGDNRNDILNEINLLGSNDTDTVELHLNRNNKKFYDSIYFNFNIKFVDNNKYNYLSNNKIDFQIENYNSYINVNKYLNRVEYLSTNENLKYKNNFPILFIYPYMYKNSEGNIDLDGKDNLFDSLEHMLDHKMYNLNNFMIKFTYAHNYLNIKGNNKRTYLRLYYYENNNDTEPKPFKGVSINLHNFGIDEEGYLYKNNGEEKKLIIIDKNKIESDIGNLDDFREDIMEKYIRYGYNMYFTFTNILIFIYKLKKQFGYNISFIEEKYNEFYYKGLHFDHNYKNIDNDIKETKNDEEEDELELPF